MNKRQIDKKLSQIRAYYEEYGKHYKVYIEVEIYDSPPYNVPYEDLKNVPEEQSIYISTYDDIHYGEIKDLKPYSVPVQ